MEEKDLIQMYELWITCKPGEGNAIRSDGKEIKMVVRIVDGNVIYVDKDFDLKKQQLKKENK